MINLILDIEALIKGIVKVKRHLYCLVPHEAVDLQPLLSAMTLSREDLELSTA